MMKIFKFMKFLLMISVMLSALSLTVYAEENQRASLTLSVEERVDEILESVLWEYTDETIESQLKESVEGKIHNYKFDLNNYATRVDALMSIMRVIGMTDDFTQYFMCTAHDDATTASPKGAYSKPGYIYVAVYMEDFQEIATYVERLKFYPLEYCTIGQALEFAARCIYKENNENYVEIAKEYDLCSTDTMERQEDYITIGELKELLINLYNVPGEVVFKPIYLFGKWYEYDMHHNETYYERYKKSSTYLLESMMLNGYEVRYAKNGWGTPFLSFADLMKKYNIDLQWDNGRITLTKSNGDEYIVCLDRFPPNLRMYCDKSMYIEHIQYDSWGYIIPYEASFDILGQYEIIDENLYITPSTYQFLLSELALNTDIVYFDCNRSTIFPEYLR